MGSQIVRSSLRSDKFPAILHVADAREYLAFPRGPPNAKFPLYIAPVMVDWHRGVCVIDR